MNEKKKYELTDETINYNGYVLHRIKALKDFNNVKKGDLGGYIKKEYNLSHEDNCWVYDNARVFGSAIVRDNAIVYDNARVFGSAEIYNNAMVCGNARVCGNAEIFGDAMICDNARVRGDAMICGNARVRGDAEIFGDATVYGNAIIFGCTIICGNAYICGDARVYNGAISNNAYINSNKDYLCIGPMGSRDDYTTFYLDKDRNIYVRCGCFCNTIDKFKDKVIETHKNNIHTSNYLTAIELAKNKLGALYV